MQNDLQSKVLSRSNFSSDFKFSTSSLLLEVEREKKKERETGISRLTFHLILALPELQVQLGQGQVLSKKASNSLHSSDFRLIKSMLEFPEFEFQIKGLEFARGWYSHGFLLVFQEQMSRSKLIPKIYLKNNQKYLPSKILGNLD